MQRSALQSILPSVIRSCSSSANEPLQRLALRRVSLLSRQEMKQQQQQHYRQTRTFASTSAAAQASASTDAPAAEAESSASSSSSPAYSFSPNVVIRQRVPLQDAQVSLRRLASTSKRSGIMAELNAQLRAQYDADGSRTALFKRGSKNIIPPGSIVNVETWNDAKQTTFSAFAGVVIAIRRRNTSTSMTLRNMVNKTGVEITYNIYSPLIKDIQVIQRAVNSKRQGGLRRARRAKLYYLRKDSHRLPNVTRAIQVARADAERQAEYQREAVRRAAAKVVADGKTSAAKA